MGLQMELKISGLVTIGTKKPKFLFFNFTLLKNRFLNTNFKYK